MDDRTTPYRGLLGGLPLLNSASQLVGYDFHLFRMEDSLIDGEPDHAASWERPEETTAFDCQESDMVEIIACNTPVRLTCDLPKLALSAIGPIALTVHLDRTRGTAYGLVSALGLEKDSRHGRTITFNTPSPRAPNSS